MDYNLGFILVLFLLIIGIAVVGSMVRSAYSQKLDRQIIKLTRLPQSFSGTRILFLSDVHAREIPDVMIERVRKEGGVDLVLIGGDLKEKGVPIERSKRNVKKLLSLAPVYMVYGNHDYDDDIRMLDVMLREAGVRVLVNESIMLEQRDGSRLRLAGTDDPRTRRENVELSLSEPDDQEGLCTIMLAHDPIVWERLKPDQRKRIDIILSGHTHGGQIRLPIIGPLVVSPNIRKYTQGWFTLSGRQTSEDDRIRMFVSRGLGTSKYPLRFMAPAQYHIFTLRAAEVSQSSQDQ